MKKLQSYKHRRTKNSSWTR